MQAAKDSTIALLSYKPDTVEQQLGAARDLLTGDFRDSYTSLTNDVVIPGAKQKQISAVATVPAMASVSADPNHAVVLVFVNQTVVVGQRRADRHRVQCAGHSGQDRRPLADLQVRPGVGVTEPQWLDVAAPTVQLRALTWGPADAPIALCLHGFPDTAYGWRKVAPALVDAGWRVVAPFMRGYAPSSLPSDGSYHVGALMDDALRVLDAAGPTGRDVFIGHDWGAIAGAGLAAMPDSPFTKAVIMSVPLSAAFRPFGRVPHSARLAAKLPRQLLRSWYIMYFQLPWLPDRSASWVIPRLWRDWSPGYRANEDLRYVGAAIGAPERGAPRSGTTARPFVAVGHRRSTPNSTGTGCPRRGCRRCICTAPTTAAPRITRRGLSGCCPTKARSRSSRTAGTSCSSISPTSSRVTSSTSLGRRASLAIRISHSAAGVEGCRVAVLRLLQAGMVARDQRQQEPPRRVLIDQRRDAVG